MKAGKRIFLLLAGILVLTLVSPLSGCEFLGMETADDESLGAISSLDGSVDKRIYKDALRIVDNLQETGYQSEAEVSESGGTYMFDSAGLVNYVLSRAAPDNYNKIAKDVDGTLGPIHYYNYISGLNGSSKAPAKGWSRIVTLANARPGDILVIEHNQASQDSYPDHVLVIVDTPVPESNGEYSVMVVDAAVAGHYRDTREADGVGKGTMYFGVNQSGAPLYYRWDDASGEKVSQSILGIVIGRAG